MKTWVDQAPIDEDFNRFETSIAHIKDGILDMEGTYSFEAIRADRIAPWSGDLVIEDANFTDRLKGVILKNLGQTTQYIMSATTENARRATVIDAGLIDYYHSRIDDIRIGQNGFSDQYPYGTSGTFANVSQYNGTGQVIIVEYKNGLGYSKASVTINNLTLSTTQTINIDSVGLALDKYRKNYYNVGAGLIQIIISEQTDRSLWEPAVFIRRCRYPIAENNPIKVLNADYSAYEQRQIAEADFTSFRIS